MGPTANGFAGSQVSVGAAATLLCAARADRKRLTLVNHGATDIFIGGSGVTTGNGALLAGVKGQTLVLRNTAAVYGIVGTGTEAVGVIEEFS